MIKMRLVNMLSDSKKYIAQTVIWQWIALLFQMAAVAAVGIMLERVLYGTAHGGVLAVTAGVFLVSMAVRFLCDKQASRSSFMASTDVKTVLRKTIHGKMLRLGASYREKIPTSEVVQLAAEGVEQLEIYFGKYLPQLFYSLLAPLTLFLVLSFVNFKASIILLICVPLIPISIVAVQKFAKKLLNKYWGIYTGLGDSFLENLQGLTTLKIYQADEKKAREMDEEAETFRKITMKVLTMQLNSISVMDVVAYGGAAVGMAVAVQEYLAGHLGLAGALAIILLASEFFIPLRLLGSFFHIAMNGMAASDKIFRLLDLEEPKSGMEILEKEDQEITLKDVVFSYEKDRTILDHITLHVPAGGFVALAGASGCGKSTIAGILMGRNKGAVGRIAVGGTEERGQGRNVALEDVAEESLMRQVTLVSHNSYLFKGTVRENLLMGNPGATGAAMEGALREVNLWAFLEEQNGLDTVLLERGSNLSGGQRQRLALARALLHDSPIYIFDEATSNIDAESEEMIMNVIMGLRGKKTVILISHRLANVVHADCIYVMDGGKIVQHGTHGELISQEGVYANLFETQRILEQYGRNQEGEKQWNAEAE